MFLIVHHTTFLLLLYLVLLSLFFFRFFFYCYGDHRDLHSFPTRRSSDLATGFPDGAAPPECAAATAAGSPRRAIDRKSTRLNSSHTVISYAVFCLKKKKKK